MNQRHMPNQQLLFRFRIAFLRQRKQRLFTLLQQF